jgi:hypothetical protein
VNGLQPHELANIFPMMSDAELQPIVDDMTENGYDNDCPIVLCGGKILDGRNRYKAAELGGVTPNFIEYDGNDPLAYVVRHNLNRRHLTREQRDDVIRRLRSEGMTLQAIADSVGVSYGTAHNATRDELINSDKLMGADGKERPAHYAPREDDDDEEEFPPTPMRYLVSDEYGGETTYTVQPDEELRVVRIVENAATQPVAVTIFSTISMEYYTPSKYIELARKVLGKIDLDPASCEEAQKTVKAKTYYTKEDDGLSQEWRGNVWCNPPYLKEQGKSNQGTWSAKFLDEYAKGNVEQGILLVKAALGYKWFEILFETLPVCFCRERLSFINEEGEDDGQSKQGTAFFYIGKDPSKFYAVFRDLGRVIPPRKIVESGLFDE